MSRPTESHSAGYFEDIYRENPDPWGFATSGYERAKYKATLGALPKDRYGRAFEIGCSIGVFTRMLAERCDRLLAVDAAEAPLAEARRRSADTPQVEVRRMRLPDEFPDGAFDLVVVSEVLYYLNGQDVKAVARRVAEALLPGGEAVLVHWTGPHALPQPLSGDEASEVFIAAAGLSVARQERAETYRLDVLWRE